jgi:hypothetical protein
VTILKTDTILKEELCRSIAVFFYSLILFYVISFLFNQVLHISIEPQAVFIFGFFFTVLYFSLMVSYRRKKQFFDPSFISIVNHLFQSDIYEEKSKDNHKIKNNNIYSLIKKNIRFLIITIFLYIVYFYASLYNNSMRRYGITEQLADPPIPKIKHITLLFITVIIYIVYLYTSLVYKIDQTYWILVLLFTIYVLLKIIYDEKENSQPASMRLLSFLIAVCIFIYIRYLVLGYPILPISVLK